AVSSFLVSIAGGGVEHAAAQQDPDVLPAVVEGCAGSFSCFRKHEKDPSYCFSLFRAENRKPLFPETALGGAPPGQPPANAFHIRARRGGEQRLRVIVLWA